MGKTVLVVDDNKEIRDTFAFLLEYDDYEVKQAENGVEALCMMMGRPADVVITDYQMPKMDGLQLLEICRAMWPDVPVIMVSGTEGSATLARQHGAFAWLSKPYDIDHLLDLIRRAMAHHAQAEHAPASA